VPETFMTGSRESAMAILKKMKMPIMLKLLSGFGGKGVIVMESKDAAMNTIDTMKTLEQDILLEEFVPNPGEDIRGILAGDEVIAAFKRVAAPGEKRANIASGGKAKAFRLDSEMQEVVFKCAEAIKSKICAVDMIESKEGPKVIEVNINPGIKGAEAATNLNVARSIINFAKSEARK